jgi:hypothetical protein
MKGVHEKILDDNYRMRDEYLARTSFVKNIDIDLNQLELWRAKKDVFAVTDHNGCLMYPSFQFENNRPIKTISAILHKTPPDISDWEVALWFETQNEYLDDKAPQECLRRRRGGKK